MLDIKAQTLMTVAETGNYTKAAARLNLTQPAVSHHIQLLEKELHAKLFVYRHGEMKLTPEGEIALKCARRMKALYENLQYEITDAEKHQTKVRVGITHTAESNLVAEVLAKYTNENPGMIIQIATHTINILYSMLDNYELDLAIVEGRPTNPNMRSLLLGTDYLVCVVPINHPLASKSMVTLDDLKKENLILRSAKSSTRNLFNSGLISLNESIDDFNVILEVDNIATIKDLIIKNFGISILANSTCIEEVRRKKIVALPVENLSMIREINIVYQKDFEHMEMLSSLMSLYQQATHEEQSSYSAAV
ncbi:MAG: LysR family transcriptional regulator [Solobacterium sp.]|jgi:DNA-binding transcriptional LysR family regulator|nr:LysR family transcriptional regulator [Solobacterium sp.]MCH4205973.1 LysR family transcriptional regulator [Solobacterium sp.]MCH4227419.1 LysR family transcriptional regulator [Solobacterium sp.]MCH4282788.1 LysR family transcriptional regulator [Solobacterium sp.]